MKNFFDEIADMKLQKEKAKREQEEVIRQDKLGDERKKQSRLVSFTQQTNPLKETMSRVLNEFGIGCWGEKNFHISQTLNDNPGHEYIPKGKFICISSCLSGVGLDLLDVSGIEYTITIWGDSEGNISSLHVEARKPIKIKGEDNWLDSWISEDEEIHGLPSEEQLGVLLIKCFKKIHKI